MNKTLALVAVVIVILAGAGYFFLKDGPSDSAVRPSKEDALTSAPESEEGVAGWIKDLMSGKSMECSYAMSDEGGATSVKMYMDKDRYRTEMDIPKAGKMISVFDGKVSYSWTEGLKQGMKMDMDCMEDVTPATPVESDDTEAVPEEETFKSPEDALQNIPGIFCKPALGGVDFSIPKDVVFTDQCQALKDSMKAMENLKASMPTNVGTALPEDVRKIMEGQ